MGRTNVVLDDALVARCQKATGIKTRRALIDHGWPSAAKPPFDFAQGPEHAERATQREPQMHADGRECRRKLLLHLGNLVANLVDCNLLGTNLFYAKTWFLDVLSGTLRRGC